MQKTEYNLLHRINQCPGNGGGYGIGGRVLGGVEKELRDMVRLIFYVLGLYRSTEEQI